MVVGKPAGRRHGAPRPPRPVRWRSARLGLLAGVLVVIVAIGSAAIFLVGRPGLVTHAIQPTGGPTSQKTSATPDSYFGVYVPGSPASYAGMQSFAAATGTKPSLALYYSGWLEPFATNFAMTAFRHDARPMVQMDPTGVSVAAIASGTYDGYLKSFAKAVRSFRYQVILSFGHEMNGQWYAWGYRHTSAAIFIAAWRHIVQIFRAVGARNVTWLWTVNTIEQQHDMIPNPAAWWPGSSYVNWVGIDGYFHKSSAKFASVFGPTIIDVRELTRDPILISETGATADVGQPAKITGLFAGIRSYGLLGFVWFDSIASRDYQITSPAAVAALRRGAMCLSSTRQQDCATPDPPS
jgi:mannan endo-1,4-beta-mannosidase